MADHGTTRFRGPVEVTKALTVAENTHIKGDLTVDGSAPGGFDGSQDVQMASGKRFGFDWQLYDNSGGGNVDIQTQAGTIKTASLTTAAGESVPINDTEVPTEWKDKPVIASIRNGTNTAGTPRVEAKISGSMPTTMFFIIYNDHASDAFNGDFYIDFLVLA